METGHPSTRAVNSGSGNRALLVQLTSASIATTSSNVLVTTTGLNSVPRFSYIIHTQFRPFVGLENSCSKISRNLSFTLSPNYLNLIHHSSVVCYWQLFANNNTSVTLAFQREKQTIFYLGNRLESTLSACYTEPGRGH